MGLADPLEKAAIEQTVISLGSILSVYPAASFSTLGRATGASTLSSTAGVADDGSARDVTLRLESEVGEIFRAAAADARAQLAWGVVLTRNKQNRIGPPGIGKYIHN